MEFVKDQIQKHYLKNPVLFPHKKHFSCCWIMPINKLMLLGIKKKKKKSFAILLPRYKATLFQRAFINTNSIGSVCNNILKSSTSTPRLHRAACQGIRHPVTAPLLLRKRISHRTPTSIRLYIQLYILLHLNFFSFCGFYPKSLQLMEKVPWPPRDFIYSSFYSAKKC